MFQALPVCTTEQDNWSCAFAAFCQVARSQATYPIVHPANFPENKAITLQDRVKAVQGMQSNAISGRVAIHTRAGCMTPRDPRRDHKAWQIMLHLWPLDDREGIQMEAHLHCQEYGQVREMTAPQAVQGCTAQRWLLASVSLVFGQQLVSCQPNSLILLAYPKYARCRAEVVRTDGGSRGFGLWSVGQTSAISATGRFIM